jgi:hypothetical protein
MRLADHKETKTREEVREIVVKIKERGYEVASPWR